MIRRRWTFLFLTAASCLAFSCGSHPRHGRGAPPTQMNEGEGPETIAQTSSRADCIETQKAVLIKNGLSTNASVEGLIDFLLATPRRDEALPRCSE